tara:strand:- start:101 stop:343 length:243 start_codon:yes stop_codon:yes gene_type:complete
MTKFSTEFIDKVKTHWEENKGKVKYVAETGVHFKRKTSKKYTLDDVADHFGITESQARRILYVKPTKPKEHISEVRTYQR